MGLIKEYLKIAFPEVDAELNKWIECCSRAEDPVLQKQALASIENKKFHAQGGSVYSLYPKTVFKDTVAFITAFQTISDYLDNLCDRAGVVNETAFLELHQSMHDAVDPDGNMHDYYSSYPHKNDGLYLRKLVEACRQSVQKLPAYNNAAEPVLKLVQLYAQLQTYKHLEVDKRQEILEEWADAWLSQYPGIFWWEFSAAAGSTLGIFLLIAASHDKEFGQFDAGRMVKAYFPWVCGLHILLDYFIDSEEDLKSGDLNFTSYYENSRQCEERMAYFIEKSLQECVLLPYPKFHFTVIRGLLAMYLSDPKASKGIKRKISRALLKKGGGRTFIYFYLCRLLRRMKKL